MATALQAQEANSVKRLREVLPENGKDTPDEYILEILKSCDLDVTRAFEVLHERLSRASWESVDKKKKADKPQSAHGAQSSQYRRQAPKNTVRGEFPRSANWDNKENRSKGGNARGPPNAVSNPKLAKPATADASAVIRAAPTEGQQKDPSAPPAEAPKPVASLAPVPTCNQWAKGRPQIDIPKAVQPPKASAPPSAAIQKLEDHLADDSIAVQVASDSASLGSTEPSEHNAATDFSDGHDDHVALEASVQEQAATSDCTEQAPHVAVSETETASFAEADVVRKEFERFAVNSDSVVEQKSEASSGFAPTQDATPSTASYTRPQEEGQSYQQPPYSQSQFAGYQQNFQSMQHPAQQHFDSAHDSEAQFNTKYYMGAGDPSYAGAANPGATNVPMSNRPGGSSYHPKGGFAKNHHPQPQQQGPWQAPPMNSFGMMGNSMFAMTPQQMYLMSMQYGMGMQYNAGAMNGQMLGGAAGYAPHNFAAGPKVPFHQGPNKKQQQQQQQQQYAGFAPGPYNNLQYAQGAAQSEEFFKAQVPSAGNYDSSFGYEYAPPMNFDSNMSSFQSSHQETNHGYNHGRSSNLATGMTGGMPSEEAPYFNSRRPYYGQQDLGQASGPWIGGN